MTVQFETLEYDVGGTKAVVKAIGEGKPVLFLHGASRLEGFDFAEGLADRFRVLCPSHPGNNAAPPRRHAPDRPAALAARPRSDRSQDARDR